MGFFNINSTQSIGELLNTMYDRPLKVVRSGLTIGSLLGLELICMHPLPERNLKNVWRRWGRRVIGENLTIMEERLDGEEGIRALAGVKDGNSIKTMPLFLCKVLSNKVAFRMRLIGSTNRVERQNAASFIKN